MKSDLARALVKFDAEKCKGCELCAFACPKKIIVIDEKVINGKGYHPACVIDMEACIACANCAMMCPDGAISVYKEGDEGKKDE